MERILLPFRQNGLLNTLFASNVFISFHYALVIYLNSSLLSKFFNNTQISALYIIGSIINIIILTNAPKVIDKITNYKFTLLALTLEFVAIFSLIFNTTPVIIALSFILHLSAVSTILFNQDVFFENVSDNESITGSIRATFLTITNIMIVLAPLSISFLVSGNDYSKVYLFSALLLIPMYFFIRKFRNLNEVKIEHIKIKDSIKKTLENKDIYRILVCYTILQLFYAFMVIYTPLYLTEYIGFSWSEIGIIFTIMLLPFVMFELPVGELEDDIYGEKEFLTIGFFIMGFFTLVISFITVKSFWLWAIVLFLTRVGASLVEVSAESYFFKKITKKESDIVSLFRLGRPVALILSPIIATIVLQFIPFQYIFIIIGVIVVAGTHFSLNIKDTR